MDPSRGMDSRYNLNYSMSSIGLSLADQADMYGNPAAVAALGGRPPSGGLIQTMGGGGVGVSGGRSGNLMPQTTQCQSLVNAAVANSVGGGPSGQQQQRGIKRAGSDCYDDGGGGHHRGGGSGGGGMSAQSLQGLESCSAGGNGQHAGQQQQQQQQQQSGGGGVVPDVVDDSYSTALQNKKSPPANGKKTKGRVKIKMEYIDNKLRRYTTFSKRKTGIMKKAYELSTLTGTQVMLLVASETGHVYTFATRKLQPMITSEAGKQLIQTCLNSPDPPSVGGGDQRMSATGFEETELSYNIADEDSKDDRSPLSSGNESDDSSDIDSPGPAASNCINVLETKSADRSAVVVANGGGKSTQVQYEQQQHSSVYMEPKLVAPQHNANATLQPHEKNTIATPNDNNLIYPASALSNIPQEVLLQLIHSGHLQLHTEEDGSGHQYVAIPLSTGAASNSKNTTHLQNIATDGTSLNELTADRPMDKQRRTVSAEQLGKMATATVTSGMMIKQELD